MNDNEMVVEMLDLIRKVMIVKDIDVEGLSEISGVDVGKLARFLKYTTADRNRLPWVDLFKVLKALDVSIELNVNVNHHLIEELN